MTGQDGGRAQEMQPIDLVVRLEALEPPTAGFEVQPLPITTDDDHVDRLLRNPYGFRRLR